MQRGKPENLQAAVSFASTRGKNKREAADTKKSPANGNAMRIPVVKRRLISNGVEKMEMEPHGQK